MSPATVPATGGRIGVLLVNLGTPDATGYWPMRRYLKEFLSDRRVIEENRLKWWFVLNFIILTVRPGRKGRDYDKIWNRDRNESPLKTITRSQSDKLDEIFDKMDKRIRIDWAMRYGNPIDPITARSTRGTGLRENPDRPALPSICRRDDGYGLRRGLPRTAPHEIAADIARRSAVLCRACLYRCACGLSQYGTGQSFRLSRT